MNPHRMQLLLTLIALAPGPSMAQGSPPAEPNAEAGQALFSDVTDALGLGPEVVPETVARVVFGDLDDDGWPDLVVDRHRVFLNRSSEAGRVFEELAETGLDAPRSDTVTVFADLDGDRHLDALIAERVDARKAGWEDHGRRTRWQRGKGDGSFEEAQVLVDVLAATTISIAVSDVDRDGRLDLWIGNWYTDYGATYGGYQNQLLLGRGVVEGQLRFEAQLLPAVEPEAAPGGDDDAGGRPTFGTRFADLDGDGRPELIELNYGRRGNRLWQSVLGAEEGGGARLGFVDIAPPDAGSDGGKGDAVSRSVGFDGDGIRHGRYPDWAVEAFAKREPPIERLPEDRFRSHGNSFDVAVADVDRDGVLDAFVSEITHGWAGESSDRSRLLLFSKPGPVEGWQPTAHVAGPAWSVDRIPEGISSWNQGDLFCELADFDLDGYCDLLLSSGDYPDDQRLRFYQNTAGHGFVEAAAGLDHDGSQQLSLADLDGDGDLDFAVGQTFNRFTAEQRQGRSPRLRVYRNEAAGTSLVLRLVGNGTTVNHHALGARVRATLDDGSVLLRELEAIGGHSGKQHDFELHLGLGGLGSVALLEVWWPDAERTHQVFEGVDAGRYLLEVGGDLQGR
ncbi:MAG: VCBS repeat-containing protein [Planctomycetota bacterium]|nr:VCBS repeat-containing protein [Planctomycetota bacterium]